MDKQTYIDLEIFETKENNTSIFKMLDCTITQGGSDALKNRFLHPFTRVEEIKQTQEIVEYLTQHTNEWSLTITEQDVKYAEHYISSSIVVFHVKKNIGGWITAEQFQWQQPDYFHFIKSSIESFHHLLQKLHSFLNPLLDKNVPQYILNLFSEVNNLLSVFQKENAEINKISRVSTLMMDYKLRHDKKENINNLLNAFYEADALFAMSKSCRKYKLSMPEISPKSKSFYIEDLRHLFIEDAVENDLIVLNKNFIFLTGPNMAGKTTFIKAAAIAVFLAHIGMGIPAKNATIPLFHEVFSSINIADNVQRGESFFLAEILRLKELGKMFQSGKKAFAVLDELFRGTNLKDAMDCTVLITELLTKKNESFFILTSHISELYERLKENKNISFLYFESKNINDQIVFSYRCKEGITDERLGLMILKNSGLPDLLSE